MSETILKYLAPSVSLLMFVLTISVHAKTNGHAVKLFGKVLAVAFGMGFLLGLGWLGWGWLTASSQWHRWSLILLWLSGPLVCAAAAVVVAWLSHALSEEAEYTSDIIYGLRWDWSYPNIEKTLAPLCPDQECQGELEQAWRSQYDIALVCRSCGFAKQMDCEYPTLKDRAHREIRRLLRTGQYKGRLQKQAA